MHFHQNETPKTTKKNSSFQPQFIFKTGRVDCPTSPLTSTNRSLPLAEFDYAGVIDFYERFFGMNEREAVAVSGGHALGGANTSGFNGLWQGGRLSQGRETSCKALRSAPYFLLTERILL